MLAHVHHEGKRDILEDHGITGQEHLLFAENGHHPVISPLIIYWLKAMNTPPLTTHAGGRYIMANPQQWPHTFRCASHPVALGTYGHSLPFALEDTMYLFDQLSRLAPLSVHYFCLGAVAQGAPQQNLTDRFFCTYLARYLKVPLYCFEIFFDERPSNSPSDSPLSCLSNSADLKHFSLYLDKNRCLNQEKVKHWLRQVYQ